MRQDVLRMLDAQALQGYEEQKEAQRQLATVQTRDYFAGMGTRALAIGHELRQPLFTIALASENLRQMLDLPDLPHEVMKRAIDRIDEQVQRAQAIIADSIDSAAGREAAQGSTDLLAALRNAVCFLEPYLAMNGVVVEQPVAATATPVRLSRVRAEQVFVNVVSNAVESILLRRQQGWSGEGRVTVSLLRGDIEVLCRVADNGAGLDASISQAAFRPFFTTKSAEGSGLGLYICRTILNDADGTITLRGREEEGAVVEICLPCAP